MTDLAVGTTLTTRLELEPVGLGHIEDLWRFHQGRVVAWVVRGW